jgi:crotonobetainyl-CoA:carnitine CoA-transferase CaiB-like acyl-CoA transferase
VRGVRVVELAGALAGAYCAKLLVDLGADVVLLEPAGGAPVRHRGPWVPTASGPRSAMHEYLDAGKRSVVVAPDGVDADTLFEWADLVIVTVDGDPDVAAAVRARVSERNPAAVVVAISGFGLTGPYARWRHSELVDWAAGGYLYLTGSPDREPVQGGGPWASLLVGATAAVGAQAALFHRSHTGDGQLVDVSAMEAIAAGHQWSLTMYTHLGVVKRRWGLRFGEAHHPMGLYRCADGWIIIGAPSREQWERLCLVTDTAEFLVDESLYAPGARFERAEEIDAALQPWLSARRAADAVAILQANRVPASELTTFPDVLASEHLAERDRWRARPEVAPAARVPRSAFDLSPGPVPAPLAAPAPGEHTETVLAEIRRAATAPRSLPDIDLRTVRVLEFSLAWAGPLAGRFLADLGADVLKVEHPASRGLGTTGRASQIGGSADWRWGMLPDPQIRAEVFPDADPGVRWWNRMGIWNKMNRGKKSLAIDAKTDAGRDILAALVGGADVVVHNYTPRGAASLGIDPASLARHRADVASVAMTGYGETGPMATHSSYGPILEASAGFDEATGYLGDGPMRLGIAFPDAVGGVHGACAILAALWERACTGRAVHVDLSQYETLLALAGDALLVSSVTGTAPARHGNRSDDLAPQGVYRCAGEDAWVAISVPDDEAWRAVVDLVGGDLSDRRRGDDLAARQADHDDIDAALSQWTATRDALEVAHALQAVGVPACPAFTNRELVHDAHLRARGFIVSWDQADVGVREFPGYPIHFERYRPEVRGAPALGADNAAVLRRLGYDDAAIARLVADEVIADRPPA